MFGDKFIRTVVLALGGTFIVMIILAVILNSVGVKKINTEDLVNLAQVQTEVIRISQQGAATSRQSTRALGTTVEYTLKTQRQQVSTLLIKHNRELGKKELTLKQNANTDKQLKAAKATSTFDLVYAQVMERLLQSYARELQTTLGKAATKSERELLSSYNQQVQLLLTQIPFTQKDASES